MIHVFKLCITEKLLEKSMNLMYQKLEFLYLIHT